MDFDYDKKYSISPDGFLINFETHDIIPVEIKEQLKLYKNQLVAEYKNKYCRCEYGLQHKPRRPKNRLFIYSNDVFLHKHHQQVAVAPQFFNIEIQVSVAGGYGNIPLLMILRICHLSFTLKKY